MNCALIRYQSSNSGDRVGTPKWTQHPLTGFSSPQVRVDSNNAIPERPWVQAFVALGSNLGDRINWIEQACKQMASSPKIKLIKTSSLWETDPMYVLDQDKFVNGVCEVSLLIRASDSQTYRKVDLNHTRTSRAT
jgi:hypothetical protein